MLDEVYLRIPDLRAGVDAVNTKLDIDSAVHRTYLTTCEAISTFLDTGKTLIAIKQLNDATQQTLGTRLEQIAFDLMKVGDRGKRTDDENLLVDIYFQSKEMKPPIVENLAKENAQRSPVMRRLLSHLLSDTLSKNELTNAFSLGKRGERDQAVTYLGFIQPDLFRAQLEQGRQWKDPTVPGGHGEFTHRIQWYMITQSLPKPQKGWRTFYQWVGQWKHTQSVSTDPAKEVASWLKLGLWDALVDRNRWDRANTNGPYNTSARKDFRSPESLHTHLISTDNEVNWLLNAFLTARAKNRAPMIETTKDGLTPQAIVARGQYLARKWYGVPLEQLDENKAYTIAYYLFDIWNPSAILEPEKIAEREQRAATNGKTWFQTKLGELSLKKQNGSTDDELLLELITLEAKIATEDALAAVLDVNV